MGELQAILDALAAERQAGRAAVLATVVGVAGSGYRRPGVRMLVTAAGRAGSVSGGCLEDDVCRRAWWLTRAGPVVVSYDTADDGGGPYRLGCGGTVRIAKQLGWHVTVADRRPAGTLRGRFPDADAVVSGDPAALPDPGADAAVVMTHSFPDDLAWLRLALSSAARYVGVLGARHRADRLVQGLGGPDGRLFGPVGLDVGADTPAEIALAVVAEARAVLAGRGGGHLRDRRRPVHDPHPVPPGGPHPTRVTAVTVACDLAGGTP